MTEHGTYAQYIAERKEQRKHFGPPPCGACMQAEREYQAVRRRQIAYARPLRTDPTGSVRRVQALMALGHSGVLLAEKIGCGRPNLPTWAKYRFMRTSKAQAIAQVYERYKDLPGTSVKTVTRAMAAGWLPPECWDGVDMDDPAAQPLLRRSDSDKLRLALRLVEVGVPRRDVALRLRMNACLVQDFWRATTKESADA